MTEWAARRFWTSEDIVREGNGWEVRLDGRPVRTPSKRSLVLPTEAMARALAAEWAAQRDIVNPATMPVTRAANTAIEKVARSRDEVVAALVAYGETDLLCYRAEAPETLAARQANGWDPLLEWAHEAFGVRLVAVVGVMPYPQPHAMVERLGAEVARLDDFELTGFDDLVTLTGSLVLGLAVEHGRLSANQGWELSRIDEEFQAELWGRDEEAEQAAAIRREAFLAAERFVALSRAKPLQP